MHPTAVLPTVARPGSPAARGPAAVARQLPLRTAPDYLARLGELVRADLRARRAAGEPVDIDEYRAEFPELFVGKHAADPAVTPMPVGANTLRTSVTPGGVPQTGDSFPAVGGEFHGYGLLEELGRGAFARVYLAAEHRLGDRPVALKLTAAASGESRRLARLQHTNIVPIQTAFTAGGLHAVQMPYFGRQTLGDVIDHVRATRQFPKVSGAVFSSTVARGSTAGRSQPRTDDRPAPARPVEPAALPGPFAGKSYPDAVLWVLTRLADGLAHAHARDILHLDLKPQNILMADDGQPMLLDFNLSLDRRTGDRDRVGGTWPYMPPEQIEEYAGTARRPIDARADLFALGVIFFELLTLRHPYPAVRPGPDGLAEAVAARRAGPPSARAMNPEVTPAVDAVVRKLLAADPADRYQSAEHLRDDLVRQQEHRPLRHAPDRSPAERLDKLRRRYPHALLYLAVAASVSLLTAGGVVTTALHARREVEQTVARANTVRAELPGLRLALTSQIDPAGRAAGVATARGWLAEYEVAVGPWWAENRALGRLTPADRAALRAAVGEAALLAAESEWRDARTGPALDRPAATARAAELCGLAVNAYGPDAAPAAVRRLAAEVAGKDAPEPAGGTPADLFAAATRELNNGRYHDAVPLLERLVDADPGHYAGQFALGVCLGQLGRIERATERLRVAQAMAPTDPRPRASLGLLLFQAGKHAAAIDELSAALRTRPNDPPSLYLRGVSRLRARDPKGAVADLDAALAAGYERLPALVVRAEAHAKLGNAEAAAADRAAALAIEPTTAGEYVARGNCRLPADKEGALADYRRAVAVRPDFLAGWQNQASVLGDMPGRAADALAAMTEAARLVPQYAPARVGHAVLLARGGRRDEAHTEAQAALLLTDDAGSVYRAGCAYALTASTHPGDATAALDLIRRAVALGFRELRDLDHDPDLAAVRGDPRYAPVAAAYRTLVR